MRAAHSFAWADGSRSTLRLIFANSSSRCSSRRSLPTLIIDLSELSYIDCSGIATLIEALRIAHQRHTNLQLRGVRDGPRHLLEVTGLLRLFETDGRTDHSSVSKVS